MLMLLCSIAGDKYAIRAASVVEVVPMVTLSPVAKASDHIAGTLHFRGIPVTVIDLSQLIANRPSDDKYHTRVIIVEHDDQLLGLIAEEVIQTAEFSVDDFIEPSTPTGAPTYMGGVCSDSNIRLLKLEQLRG
jgi:chemotaxis signal transduction protein